MKQPLPSGPQNSVCHLRVFLSPRAKINAVVGRQGEEMKIKIAAPPVEGAANEALLKYLAAILGLKIRCLSLVAGQTGRHKIVKIEGLDETDLWDRLKQLIKEDCQ